MPLLGFGPAALRDVRAASEAGRAFTPAQAPGSGFADTLNVALRQVSAVQEHSSQMQVAYERGQVTDIAQVMLARQEAGVATIGGPDFGVHGEGFIRLSYANSLENIERALVRMKQFLETVRPVA